MTDEQAITLCAAIIEQAHDDYIRGTPYQRSSAELFVNSPLFQLYTAGIVRAEPKEVLALWETERRERIAESFRVCTNGGSGSKKGIFKIKKPIPKTDR